MSRLKSPHQQRVERFMAAAEQTVPDRPTMPGEATRMLRARLIMEEAMELIDALGIRLTISSDRFSDLVGHGLSLSDLTFAPAYPPSLVEAADGCADLSVVTIGTLSAMGVADESLLELVDQNNLEKFDGGYRDYSGKWIKPPNHKPPDIARCLEIQAGLP